MCVFTLRDMEVFHLHQKKSRCQRPGNAPTVNDLVESDFQQKLPGGIQHSDSDLHGLQDRGWIASRVII